MRVVILGVGKIGLYTQSINIVGWQQTTLVQLFAVTITFAFLVPFVRGKERVFSKAPHALTSGLMVGTIALQLSGLLAINAGIGRLPEMAAVIVALSALYPVLTVF